MGYSQCDEGKSGTIASMEYCLEVALAPIDITLTLTTTAAHMRPYRRPVTPASPERRAGTFYVCYTGIGLFSEEHG